MFGPGNAGFPNFLAQFAKTWGNSLLRDSGFQRVVEVVIGEPAPCSRVAENSKFPPLTQEQLSAARLCPS